MTRHTDCSKVCEMKNTSCLETTLPPIQFRHPGPPLYQQLADQLRQAILDNSLHPGEKLPTLQQMASLCGVARVTARQAVQLLVSEGYLETRQGRGTHVAQQLPLRPCTNMRTSWSALIKRIEGASVELLAADEVVTCPLLRGEQKGIPAACYQYMKRVHIKDGVRFAFIDLYLDKDIYDLAPERFNATTVIPVMDELGVDVTTARQILTIGIASPEAANHLGIACGMPVAQVERFACDKSGKVVYAASMVHPGDRVRFEIDLVR